MALPAPAAPAAFDVTCDTAALKQAVDLCTRVVERRNSLPILANILFETGYGSRLHIRATDLEVSVTCELLATFMGFGATTVHAQRLQKVLKGITAASVRLAIEGERFVVTSEGGGRVELLTMDAKEFPSQREPDPKSVPATIEFDAGVLATLLGKVAIAVSSDETRLSLGGVFFELIDKGKALRLVATDGHRLAMIDWPLKGKVGELPKNLIVPKKAIGLLMRLDALKARKGEPRGRVTLQVHPPKGTDMTLICASVPIGDCSAASASLTTRCIEGQYPDYAAVIPKGPMLHRATLKREEWLAALKRLRPLLNERSRGVKVFLSRQKGLELVAQNPDTGVSVERIAAVYQGIGVSTGFNAAYLVDALTVGDGDEVLLELTDDVSPGRLTFPGDPTYTMVIMPMRL